MFLTAQTGRDWKCLKVDCPVSQMKISEEFPDSTTEQNDKTYIILLSVSSIAHWWPFKRQSLAALIMKWDQLSYFPFYLVHNSIVWLISMGWFIHWHQLRAFLHRFTYKNTKIASRRQPIAKKPTDCNKLFNRHGDAVIKQCLKCPMCNKKHR